MNASLIRDRLAGWLAGLAARRLRKRYAEWSDAMLSEQTSLAGEPDALEWAIGSIKAGVVLSAGELFYPALLALAVCAMGLYQWSADEGPVTVLVMGGLGLCLGFARPSRALVSGLGVGAVVAAVNAFETISGIRPAYELHIHSLMHDGLWLVLVLPTLVFSLLGRHAGLKLAV